MLASPIELRRPEVNATRSRALHLQDAKAIQHLETYELVALQTVLRHGERFGLWQTPRSWVPAETSPARLNIDLRARILNAIPLASHTIETTQGTPLTASTELPHLISGNPKFLIDALLDRAVLLLTRYLLLLRMGPVGMGDRNRLRALDPSGIRMLAYRTLPTMVALAIVRLTSTHGYVPFDRDSLLHPIQLSDLDALPRFLAREIRIEFDRMHSLTLRGYWHDLPEQSVGPTRILGPAIPQPSQPVRDVALPLPDDYVADMGRRSMWLILDLGPNLLHIGAIIRHIWANTGASTLSPGTKLHRRRETLQHYLATYVWRDRNGHAFTTPPFTLHLPQLGKRPTVSSASSTPSEWPPRTFGDVMELMRCLQLAHLFVVALSTGARRSETLSLTRTCLVRATDGQCYASGRTYKLVQYHDGEPRDWVLPDLAVTAIEQQVRLVNLVEGITPLREIRARPRAAPYSADHLWTQIYGSSNSDRAAPLHSLGDSLRHFAHALELTEQPGGQFIRPHRFRKTTARLVALALTQAPTILMNVLGHHSISMTLYYILTDKDLRADIETVARELRIMRAKEVIENMVRDELATHNDPPLGGYGGPAALAIQRAIRVHRSRRHQHGQEWGATSALELAEILTLQGKAWQFVRHGILCTKFPGTESGPCNHRRGHPEPARCQSTCAHRLEEAFLHDDVDGAIRDAVDAYRAARQNGENLMQALWAGQLRTHVPRFPDLYRKWMADPLVREIVSTSPQEV